MDDEESLLPASSSGQTVDSVALRDDSPSPYGDDAGLRSGETLRHHYYDLRKRLSVDGDMTAALFSRRVINLEEMEAIRNVPAERPYEAADKLLGWLIVRGYFAFDVFCEFLEQSLPHNQELEKTLRQTWKTVLQRQRQVPMTPGDHSLVFTPEHRQVEVQSLFYTPHARGGSLPVLVGTPCAMCGGAGTDTETRRCSSQPPSPSGDYHSRMHSYYHSHGCRQGLSASPHTPGSSRRTHERSLSLTKKQSPVGRRSQNTPPSLEQVHENDVSHLGHGLDLTHGDRETSLEKTLIQDSHPRLEERRSSPKAASKRYQEPPLSLSGQQPPDGGEVSSRSELPCDTLKPNPGSHPSPNGRSSSPVYSSPRLVQPAEQSTPAPRVGHSASMPDKVYAYRVAILGDVSVGKTVFVHSTEPRQEGDTVRKLTLGVDDTTIKFKFGEVPVQLTLCDTAGMERFNSLVKTYLRICDGFILMYDVTQMDTLHHVKRWHKFAMDLSVRENPPVLVLGNKVDIAERFFQNEDGENMASKLNATHFSGSALNTTDFWKAIEILTGKLLETQRLDYQAIHLAEVPENRCCPCKK